MITQAQICAQTLWPHSNCTRESAVRNLHQQLEHWCQNSVHGTPIAPLNLWLFRGAKTRQPLLNGLHASLCFERSVSYAKYLDEYWNPPMGEPIVYVSRQPVWYFTGPLEFGFAPQKAPAPQPQEIGVMERAFQSWRKQQHPNEPFCTGDYQKRELRDLFASFGKRLEYIHPQMGSVSVALYTLQQACYMAKQCTDMIMTHSLFEQWIYQSALNCSTLVGAISLQNGLWRPVDHKALQKSHVSADPFINGTQSFLNAPLTAADQHALYGRMLSLTHEIEVVATYTLDSHELFRLFPSWNRALYQVMHESANSHTVYAHVWHEILRRVNKIHGLAKFHVEGIGSALQKERTPILFEKNTRELLCLLGWTRHYAPGFFGVDDPLLAAKAQSSLPQSQTPTDATAQSKSTSLPVHHPA